MAAVKFITIPFVLFWGFLEKENNFLMFYSLFSYQMECCTRGQLIIS